jgi:AcrR family transcriptional regulator
MKKIYRKTDSHIGYCEELIAKKGYEGTSVRDICSKANINVAMISYYFGSKEK